MDVYVLSRYRYAVMIALLLPVLPAQARADAQQDWPASFNGALRAVDFRDDLKAAGIDVTYNYTAEYFNVVSGGVSQGSSFNGLLEQKVYLDLEKLGGWRGAQLHAHAFGIHGKGAGVAHLGDVTSVSNIEALETVRLFELWVEQSLFDGRLKVRVGQLAADSFFVSETAAQFFNGTFGWPSSTAANMVQGGPAYPLASPGVRVELKPADDITLLAAIYNGSPADPNAPDAQRDNRHGLKVRFSDPPLVMGEAQFGYVAGLPGMFKLGGWYEFSDVSDKLTGAQVDGNSGVYAVIDQGLWKDPVSAQAINFLARVSAAPERQNEVSFYSDAGLVFTGFVPGRPNDTIGLAAGYSRVSPRVRERQRLDGDPVISDFEAVLELNYSAEIMPGWTVAPDFHYIWHPGGGAENPEKPGTAIDNTVVVGVRTSFTY